MIARKLEDGGLARFQEHDAVIVNRVMASTRRRFHEGREQANAVVPSLIAATLVHFDLGFPVEPAERRAMTRVDDARVALVSLEVQLGDLTQVGRHGLLLSDAGETIAC